MSELPFLLPPDSALELAAALDAEGKILRALDVLGPVVGRDMLLVDARGSAVAAGLDTLGARVVHAPVSSPFQSTLEDQSVDIVLGMWSAFRGIGAAELSETDRILRPGGRLLILHDYGRDDVSRLQPDREEYGTWTRRSGPFLSTGFRVRVVHCFWTFETMEAMNAFLERAFGSAGVAVAATLKRPRLSYNVAIYHRTRGGDPPEGT